MADGWDMRTSGMAMGACLRAHMKKTGLGYVQAMNDLEIKEELAALKRAAQEVDSENSSVGLQKNENG